MSLNVRGIRSFGRRKSIFNWLLKSPADICFVQETYSTPEVEISIQNFNWCSRIAKLRFLSRRSGIRRAFRKFDIVEDYMLINHILWIGKYYIYYRKCQNSVPSIRGFIARARRVFNIELHIAREKNKLLFHFQKWVKLTNALNSSYNSFKIFPWFWLAKSTRIILHNQFLMNKFGILS